MPAAAARPFPRVVRPGVARAAASTTTVEPAQTKTAEEQSQGGLRGLYPASTPFKTGYLRVSDLHTIYYEVHGNPRGAPALFLHGGPGAGCYANHARFFDPAHYMTVLLDQRGCGRSTPRGALISNSTADLVEDLEALRSHLGISRWATVLGGSWGTALGLAYAQAHPERMRALVLRGVCLMRPHEIAWVYAPAACGGGAAAMRPVEHAAFVGALPAEERAHLVLGYYRRLLSDDQETREAAARSWMAWEMAVFSGVPRGGTPPTSTSSSNNLPPPYQPGDAARRAGGAAAWVTAPQTGAPGSPAPFPALPPLGPPPPASTLAGADAVLSAAVAAERSAARAAEALSAAAAAARQAAAAAPGDGAAVRGWEWGVPAIDSACLEDSEVASLLRRGLEHPGNPSASPGAAQALLTAHYCLHGAFLGAAPLLAASDALSEARARIRCVAVQGGADLVCPPANAVALSEAWPEADVTIVAGAGHSMYHPAISHEILSATDRLRAL